MLWLWAFVSNCLFLIFIIFFSGSCLGAPAWRLAMILQTRRQRRGRRRRRSLTTPRRTPHPSTNPPYLQREAPYQKQRTKRRKISIETYKSIIDQFLLIIKDLCEVQLKVLCSRIYLYSELRSFILIVVRINDANSMHCERTLVVLIGFKRFTTSIRFTLLSPSSWLSTLRSSWWKCRLEHFGQQLIHNWTSTPLLPCGGEKSCSRVASSNDSASRGKREHQCRRCRIIWISSTLW